MNILTFLIVGLIAGWLASVLVEGHGRGVAVDIVIGVIGAFVGGFIYNAIGISSYGLLGAIVMSVVGSVALLFVIGIFTRSHIKRKRLD